MEDESLEFKKTLKNRIYSIGNKIKVEIVSIDMRSKRLELTIMNSD